VVHIPAPMQAPDQLYKPFTSADWIYEIKYDGYRCLAGIEAGQVRLRTKALRDCTDWFPEIALALAAVPGGPHVIDGEACVLGEHGVSDFNRLQERARRRRRVSGAPAVTLCAFDLLQLHGQPTVTLPLEERKELLRELLAGVPRIHVLYVDHLPADAALFAAMVQAGLPIEGVMAKRRESPYLPGVRSDSWRKVKRPGWRDGRIWKN
jgi:bifunctional non-homologous end joining protein LigD